MDLMSSCCGAIERPYMYEALKNWIEESNGFPFILCGFRRREDEFCELLKLSDFLLVIMDNYVLNDFPNFLGKI